MIENARALPRPAPEALRGLVVTRVVVVSTLLLSALLIQLTFSIWLPLSPIYYFAAAAYSTSALAVATRRLLDPGVNAVVQLLGDLVVVTGLVWISGGPDSGFTFLYLAVVVSGTLLLGKGGGLVTAGLASVFYAVLLQLIQTGTLPAPRVDELPVRVWTPGQLAGNIVTNVGAFAATALLVAAASEKLRDARLLAERRKKEVERLQALHSSVLASMSSGVVTAGPDGRITFVNPPAGELLQRRPEDLVGQPLVGTGLISEELLRASREPGREVLRFEGSQTHLGPGAYFGVTVTPLRDGEGRVTGQILIFQNLTELKKLEGEVRLKEKLAAVGELAAAIAHEIRNPLASISGSVQVLSSTARPGSSERRLMEIVVQESHRLSSILEDFLKYVRPREQAVETVDAPAALRDVVTLLTHSDELSPAHSVTLDLVPESVPLRADPGQLRQVFWNLIRNALAAMPGGGTLSLTSRVAGAAGSRNAADEGRGMSREHGDRLFTPFAHAVPGGTGLGLAIVYRIVEEHGGKILVKSAPGQGTAISLSLPLAGPGARIPSLPERPAAAEAGS
ncbi:MAG: PAS domain-containing protein [Thermoanaerobaculia bacterium]|nr:PAS domain-containing protein [Thermoanaerobaculia bacterium]